MTYFDSCIATPAWVQNSSRGQILYSTADLVIMLGASIEVGLAFRWLSLRHSFTTAKLGIWAGILLVH